jgi:transcription antitermination factor NusG
MDWGVVTTVPACEHKAKADLTSVGFSCYFPRYESVEAVRGQIVRRARPLFPGYIFFGPVDFWRSVFDSERVLGVLMCDDERPSHLPQEVIDELHERESPEGVIKFDTKKPRRFRRGQLVQMRSGVLTGLSGSVENFASMDRIRVLFDMFGRKTTVLVREAELIGA